jgi:hypothetical protein
VSYNGITPASQADNEGSIPFTRSNRIFVSRCFLTGDAGIEKNRPSIRAGFFVPGIWGTTLKAVNVFFSKRGFIIKFHRVLAFCACIKPTPDRKTSQYTIHIHSGSPKAMPTTVS